MKTLCKEDFEALLKYEVQRRGGEPADGLQLQCPCHAKAGWKVQYVDGELELYCGVCGRHHFNVLTEGGDVTSFHE